MQTPLGWALYVFAGHAVHVGLLDPPHVPDSCWPAGHDARHGEQTRSDVLVAGWDSYEPVGQAPETAVHTVFCVAVHADDMYEPEPHTAQVRHWPELLSAYMFAPHDATHWFDERNLPAAHCTHSVGLVHTLHDVEHSWQTEFVSL